MTCPGVVLPGYGEVRIDERIDGGGGYFEGADGRSMLGDEDACLAGRPNTVVLLAPGP